MCTVYSFTVPLGKNKLCYFADLYIGEYCAFVCGTLFPRIKLIELYPEAKFHIQKYDGLENIEKRGHALEVTLGSSTDTNLGHNHTKLIFESHFRGKS